MIKLLIILTKTAIGVVGIGFVTARMFFPEATQELIIDPARKMPVFGQVLGSTWDGTGKIGPALSQKTVSLADDIESSEFGINEKITDLSSSQDPAGEISKTIEEQIDEKVDEIKDLPKNMVNSVKEKAREEVYAQICREWANEKVQEENEEKDEDSETEN
jgi:hypothetical protein